MFVAGAYVDDLAVVFHAALLRLTLIGGIIVAATILVGWLINRDITISLGGLKVTIERLASGDLAIVIPGVDRRDEVGDMVGSVLVFKEHMVKGRA